MDALPILYQDEHLVAVNKPSGLLVHRTLLDRHATEFAVQKVRDQIGQIVYPVHRLDRATSGALVFALSSDMARQVSSQFAAGEVEKTYLALVRGTPPPSITIDYALKEILDDKADALGSRNKNAQDAVTLVKTLKSCEFNVCIDKFPTTRYSLVQASPKTGRKHQIRRHLRHLGHPVVGDVTHGVGKHNRFFRERFQIHRLLLACLRMSFVHPASGNRIQIDAPLAEDFSLLVEQIVWDSVGE